MSFSTRSYASPCSVAALALLLLAVTLPSLLAQETVTMQRRGGFAAVASDDPDAQTANGPAAANRLKGPLAPDRVAGRVVSAADGHPVPRAVVTLQSPRSRQALVTTRTDTEGRYRFDPQPAGKYNLQANAPGYLGSTYQQHEGFSTSIVLGSGLETDALDLQLTPSAVIAGRVVDEAGDPVQHAQLTLYRENPTAAATAEDSDDSNATGRISRARNTQTEDDGTFEFAGVAPGRFFLSANATPWYAVHPRTEPDNAYQAYRAAVDPALDVAYPETFYPNSIDESGAAPIVIKGGEQLAANLVMQPQHAVTLTLRLPSASADERNRHFPTLTRTVFGLTESVQNGFGGGDGQTVSLTGLTPGRYHVQTFSPGNRAAEDAGTVDLTDGSTTMDMPAGSNGSAATVQLTLHTANGAALPADIQLTLRSAQTAPFRGPLSRHFPDSGEVTLPNVSAGDYRFALFHAGRPLNVLSVAVNGKRSTGERLHVSGSGDIKADLTVTTYAPTVEGFAQHDGKGSGGSMVVLVPAGADTGASLFRRDQSDLDGSFTLTNVVPGNYLLIAVEDGWKLPRWNDAAALTPYLTHAVPVTIAESGNGTVHLSDSVAVQPR